MYTLHNEKIFMFLHTVRRSNDAVDLDALPCTAALYELATGPGSRLELPVEAAFD